MAPNLKFGAFYVGMDQNLHDVMNAVSATLERRGLTPRRMPRGEVLSEFQAFAALDPLLLDLNKEYLNTKEYRLQIEKDFGCDDGMTDMAMLAEDSAWCAMQTRYMELREDRALMVQAQQLMEESRLADERAKTKEKERDALELCQKMELMAHVRATQQRKDDDLWLLVFFMLCCGGRMPFSPAYTSFNRLAA